MKFYCKIKDGEIASFPIHEANLEMAIEGWTPANTQAYGFKEIIDVAPEVTTLQYYERQGFTLKSDGIVSYDYTIVDVSTDNIVDEVIKNRRTMMLAASDWTQVSDSPLTAAKKAEWATYRQALRDLPAGYADMDFDTEVVWPTEPS
jgi:serine/threonine protein phosphatase PrpC